VGGGALEFGAIPMGEISAGVVGALAKIEEGLFGRVGETDIVVHQEEFAFLRVVEGFGGLNGAVLEAGGSVGGVSVEGGVLDDFSIAGPEADADYFVRVAFFCDGVRIRANGRAAAGETRDGEIEAAPEEMDGA
jgi:hypothetical protein